MATQLNDWLSIDKISGTGNAEITLTASSYKELTQRTKSLVIKGQSENKKVYVNVIQNAFTPTLTVQPTSILIPYEGGEDYFVVYSNTSWVAEKYDEWLTIDKTSGNGDTIIIINTEPNSGYEQRHSTITFKYGENLSSVIEITQGSYIDVTPDILCTYNNVGLTTLCNDASLFKDIKVNGVSIGLVNEYELSENDIVEFYLKGRDIPPLAFKDTSLKTVEFGDMVEKMGHSAFENCDNLSDIYTNNIIELEAYCFEYCDNLRSLRIGKGLKTINGNTFDSVVFDTIIVDEKNPFFDSREGCNCLIETQAGILHKGSNNSYIPEGITVINNSSFKNCVGLTGQLIIPDTVTYIGYEAFSGCENISGNLNLPNTISYIGDYAFMNCRNLNGTLELLCPIIVLKHAIFAGCGFTEIILSDTIKHINSVETETVTIGKNVKSLGNYAVYGDDVKNIKIKATTPPQIGISTFRNTQSSTLYYPKGSDYSEWFEYFGTVVEMDLNDFPNTTCSNADSGIDYTTQINPYSIVCTYVGRGLLRICSDAETFKDIKVNGVSVGLKTQHYITDNDIVEFVTYGFFGQNFIGCSALKTVIIGDCVSVASSNIVFKDCFSLRTLIIGNGIEKIGEPSEGSYSHLVAPFDKCPSLREIKIKTTIPLFKSNNIDDTWAGWGVLSHPEGSDYSSIISKTDWETEVIDPNSLSITGNGWGVSGSNTNPKLTCTYNKTGTTKLCKNTSSFSDIKINGASIGLVTEYRLGENDIVEFYLKEYRILPSAFDFCTNLQTVNIGNGVRHIGGSCFSTCKALNEVILSESVKTIGMSAFDSNCAFTNFNFENIIAIGDYAFSSSNLTSVNLPTIKFLGGGVFKGSPSLKTVSIDTEVELNDTFENCGSLQNVNIPNVVRIIRAFFGTKITNIELPNVEDIGYQSFQDSSLKQITIGEKIEYLSYDSFLGTNNLTTIIIKSQTPPNIYRALSKDDYPEGVTIYYPVGANYKKWLPEYLKKRNWAIKPMFM